MKTALESNYEQVQQRLEELLVIAREGQLTPEQQAELDHFLELEHILRMAKVRVRQILTA